MFRAFIAHHHTRGDQHPRTMTQAHASTEEYDTPQPHRDYGAEANLPPLDSYTDARYTPMHGTKATPPQQ
jgi:hypothetical protein